MSNEKEQIVIKFTEDELTNLNSIQKTYSSVTAELGQLKVSRIRMQQQADLLTKREDVLVNNFTDAQKSEADFVKDITKKYGDGALDPKTGNYIVAAKNTKK